jgi:hypothetical protein
MALGLAAGTASGFLFFGYAFIVAAASGPNKQYLSDQSLPLSVLLAMGSRQW